MRATAKAGSDGQGVVARVRTPTVIQMEAVECGAAALAIVLAYYGRFVPLEELRVACGVSRDGSKANYVVQAARQYGMTARGLRREPESLAGLRPPYIVFWEFNHFLVVEGFGRDRVYLNDPAVGPRTVTHDEFDESFTGIVLELRPGPDFQTGQKPAGVLAGLGKRLRGSESALAYVVLAGLALVVPGLAVPAFSQLFVNDVLLAGRGDWVGPLLAGMLLTALLRYGLTWIQSHYLFRMQAKISLVGSGTLLWHLLHLPVVFFTQRSSGDISSRVALNDRIAELLSGGLATTGLSLVTVVFYAAVMFRYDVMLTLIGIFMAVLNFVALRVVNRRRADINLRLLKEQGKLLGTAINGLQMIETLKATGAESDFFARWAGYQANVVSAGQDLGRFTLGLDAVPTLLAGLNTAIILGFGSLRVMDGSMTVGALVAFQSLMVSFTEPIQQFVGLGSSVQEMDGAIKRLDDVFHYEADPASAADGPAPPDADVAAGAAAGGAPGRSRDVGPKLSGHLELRDVTFGYSRLAPPLIQGFHLKLKPGDRVALVGATGSGKSTVAKLVAGLYAPWEGQILLDGRPRAEVPRRVLCNSLATVDQDVFLFEGTVNANVTLWDDTLDEARVIEAARDACIHEDVSARPGGYESHVTEGGANLSGGQRQRLEIARALASDPTVIVLDEATASLDPITEQRVLENVRRRGCTCLVIAHRLSTIRDCDEIIVLQEGKVVQRGTHEELLAVAGTYARLIMAQTGSDPAGAAAAVS